MKFYTNKNLINIYYRINEQGFIETWKDVIGYEGHYMVSDLGRVKSLNRQVPHSFSGYITMPERILSQKTNKKGYLEVNLAKNGVHKSIEVQRLVATAFISNPMNLPQVNHKNRIKTDNRVLELEWVTPSQNICHSFSVGDRKIANKTGDKNPNYNNFKMYLNTQNGIYYNVHELAILLNRTISGVRSMFYRSMPEVSNFIKV